MLNDPTVPGSDPKDTSLPGREEEVIVNEQSQLDVINDQENSNKVEDEGVKRFKEGLQDNDNTEVPTQ